MWRGIPVMTVGEEIRRQMPFRRVRVDDNSDDVGYGKARDDQIADDHVGVTLVTPAVSEHLA